MSCKLNIGNLKMRIPHLKSVAFFGVGLILMAGCSKKADGQADSKKTVQISYGAGGACQTSVGAGQAPGVPAEGTINPNYAFDPSLSFDESLASAMDAWEKGNYPKAALIYQFLLKQKLTAGQADQVRAVQAQLKKYVDEVLARQPNDINAHEAKPLL